MKHRASLGTLLRITPVGLLLCGSLAGFLASSSPAADPALRDNKYIGAGKCESCHDAEASGNQFGSWKEAGHSHAMEALKSDEAKKIAAERGIGDPSKSDECLQCHVTAFGMDEKLFKKSFDPAEGVSCETCHGPGDDHARARLRAANEEEEEEGFGEEAAAASYTEIPEGEILEGLDPKLCFECHNEKSPTYKPFHFCERVKEVMHLNPLKPRTDAEKAALKAACLCPDESCACDEGKACKVCGATGE